MAEPRAARIRFWSFWFCLWAVLALVCAFEPVVGDCWFGVDWRNDQPTFRAFVEHAINSYHHYNPRFGENFLILTAAWPLVHVLMTPVVVMASVVALVVLATGRVPRPSLPRATGTLVLTTALVCLTWNVGSMLFYRPYCTNYLYGFCIQAWFLAVFRLGLAPQATRGWRLWAKAFAMIVLGVSAGLCNEHTGPTWIVACGALGWLIVRRERRALSWVLPGILAFACGFALLLAAPGQRERHNGKGNVTVVERVLSRSAKDLGSLGQGLLIETALPLIAFGAATLLSRRRRRSASPQAEVPSLADPEATWPVPALLAAAVAVAATLVASPVLAERLYFASALLVVAATVRATLLAASAARAYRVVQALALAICLLHAVVFVRVQVQRYADHDARKARLEAAQPGESVYVPPARAFVQSHFSFGDDLSRPNWRGWIGRRYALRQLLLDSTEAAELERTGVPLTWEGREGAAPTAMPPEPARRLDAATFTRLRQEGLAQNVPEKADVCLRLWLPPRVGQGRALCVARFTASGLVPVGEVDGDSIRFHGDRWAYATYLATLDGGFVSLTAIQVGAEVVYSVPAASSPRFVLGCDQSSCAIGGVLAPRL